MDPKRRLHGVPPGAADGPAPARHPAALLATVAAYTARLPSGSDSVTMALIHLPILAWAYAGWTFRGTSWRDPESRMRYVRYNGELLILASLVALGGIVFSGVTIAVFEFISKNAGRWYSRNVGVVGAAGCPCGRDLPVRHRFPAAYPPSQRCWLGCSRRFSWP